MKAKTICFASALLGISQLVLASSNASAADLSARVYSKAPALPPVMNWTGFYAGGNVGYGWEDPAVMFSPTDVISADEIGPQSTSFNTQGAVGGVQFGYNQQFDRSWLAGFEADLSGSGIKGHGSTGFTAFPTTGYPFTANASEDVKWFGTVRARLGFLPTPELLLFGTGGFAYGQVNHSASIYNTTADSPGGITTYAVTCNPFANCYAGSSPRVAYGWTAGGGFEYAVGPRWTVKVEYLYVNLGKDTVTANATSIDGDGSSAMIAAFSDTHFNLVRIGANYRF